MKRLLAVLVTVVVLAGAFAPAVVAGGASGGVNEATCEYPLEFEDAGGETFTLEEPPERVVALQPSDVQLVYEIGAEETLVGMPINQYTDAHDPGDRTNIDVAGEESVDIEAVIDLEPDLVLAAAVTVDDDVEQLRNAGLTVYQFETAAAISDIRESVFETGLLTGECGGALERIGWMDDRLEALEDALEGEERPLAYWSLGFGWTAGEGTFQEEILETAGVENLASAVGIEGWMEISDEQIVDADPEWIVYGVESDGESPELSEGAMATTAYEEDNLVAVSSNQVNQPAPHVVYAIEDIVEAVHPEAYAEAQAELGLETDLDSAGGDEEADADGEGADADDTGAGADEADDEASGSTDEGDDSAESIPGFTLPAAVVAVLVGTGLFARRRR
ncbi:PGF-CTERM-anchored ABC transporter substrate-binding protein [Natronobiforma cellulositropha]|uniref:PGF-CTERM-anchored ABC transporter substrate-binding protein n=1 Tax=Natronobiforma cellulositropha TaxID=1679076 RepID=UPI0021D5E632|nr:PGF-CTERM-anchored ABC transporter substrate-binding protein [Natronobiforma cellulositropha]